VRIDVFTIFPNLITDFCSETLLGRAQKNGLLSINAHDLRDGASDKHRSIDDTPFGGGAGMVLAPEPVFKAIEATDAPRPLYLLSPGGRTFDQKFAHELAEENGFSLLCGRYEGVDQRITDNLCDGEISIGDFVLAGGEVAALTIIEATTRLIPGVMGNDKSAEEESFAAGMLEYPQYTRPATFREWDVPEILQSGDHKKISEWRHAAALVRTLRARPEMIDTFTDEQQRLLQKYFPEHPSVSTTE
jgi:tRNA (guanine37-N1)-methyltransferase